MKMPGYDWTDKMTFSAGFLTLKQVDSVALALSMARE